MSGRAFLLGLALSLAGCATRTDLPWPRDGEDRYGPAAEPVIGTIVQVSPETRSAVIEFSPAWNEAVDVVSRPLVATDPDGSAVTARLVGERPRRGRFVAVGLVAGRPRPGDLVRLASAERDGAIEAKP